MVTPIDARIKYCPRRRKAGNSSTTLESIARIPPQSIATGKETCICSSHSGRRRTALLYAGGSVSSAEAYPAAIMGPPKPSENMFVYPLMTVTPSATIDVTPKRITRRR